MRLQIMISSLFHNNDDDEEPRKMSWTWTKEKLPSSLESAIIRSLIHSSSIHTSIRSSLTISLGGLGGKQRLVQVFWRRRRPRIVSWMVNWAKTIEPKYVWGRVCCTFLLNIHLRLPLWPQLWHDTRYQSIQTVVNKNRVYVFTVHRHHLGKFAGVKIITWISTVIWSFSPTCILLLGMHCARSLPFLPHVHHTVVKVSQNNKRVETSDCEGEILYNFIV